MGPSNSWGSFQYRENQGGGGKGKARRKAELAQPPPQGAQLPIFKQGMCSSRPSATLIGGLFLSRESDAAVASARLQGNEDCQGFHKTPDSGVRRQDEDLHCLEPWEAVPGQAP